MRLLFVTHNFPRFPGDRAGNFIATLASHLASAGHEVRIVAPHAHGAAEEEQLSDRLSVRRFRYGPARFERLTYRGDLHERSRVSLITFLGIPALLGAFAMAVRTEVRRFRPDLVHAHWWVPGGLIAIGAGPPVVVTCHGSDVRLLTRSSPARWVGSRVLRRVAAVTAISRFLAEDLARLGAGCVTVTPMPVDLERFTDRRAEPKLVPPQILFAGNLVPSKGVDVLLDAFALIRAEGIDAGLRIVGDGPMRDELQSQARRLGVAERVQWLGVVSHTEMPRLFASSTVAVLPSRAGSEGLGLVLVEALASGTAVIGSAAGGIVEVVLDRVTGLTFPAGDATALSSRLRSILSDDALRLRLTAEGKRRVERTYSIPEASSRFLEVYASVLGDARSSVSSVERKKVSVSR